MGGEDILSLPPISLFLRDWDGGAGSWQKRDWGCMSVYM